MPTVLITGANRGIGLALAKNYKQKQLKVLATARNLEKASDLKQIADQLFQLDVSSLQSIEQFAKQVQEPIDLLINNAGVYHKSQLNELNYENMLQEFQVNSLGPLFISRALLPQLKKAQKPKMVCLTSRMGSIADNTSGGSYGYRASKAALNAMMKSWSIDVQEVPCLLIHPGFIQTDMTSGRGEMGTEECSKRIVENILEPFCAGKKWQTGQFVHRDGEILPW